MYHNNRFSCVIHNALYYELNKSLAVASRWFFSVLHHVRCICETEFERCDSCIKLHSIARCFWNARNVLREQPRSSSVSAYSLEVIRIIINSTMNEYISVILCRWIVSAQINMHVCMPCINVFKYMPARGGGLPLKISSSSAQTSLAVFHFLAH